MSAIAAAMILLAAAPVMAAEKPIVMGKPVATAMILSLACTGDMAPRRQALIRFLTGRGFTAVDVHEHPLAEFDNSEVAAFDAGHHIVNFYWLDAEDSGQYDVSLVAAKKGSGKVRRLADALEEMVRKSFNCKVDRLPVGNYETPAREYSAWVRGLEEAMRGAGSKPVD